MTAPLNLDSADRKRPKSGLLVSGGLVALAAFSLVLSANVKAANAYRVTVPVSLQGFGSMADAPPGTDFNANAPDPYSLADSELANPDAVREEAFVGPAASVYRFAGKTAQDRNRALYCLTAAIYYEAASESDEGQRGVAQVVLNRVRHPSFPASVCGVVFQGSARTTGCQFSFACDGSMARKPSASAWARASRAAGTALAGKVFPSVGLATHYHTQAIWPRWGKSLVMTNVVGAHIFHRWRGRWGEPAAFVQRYAGIEPTPGPYRPIADQLAGVAAGTPSAPASTAIAPMPPTSGAARPAATAPQAAPASDQPAASNYRDPTLAKSGQVREDYRTSGQWIAK